MLSYSTPTYMYKKTCETPLFKKIVFWSFVIMLQESYIINDKWPMDLFNIKISKFNEVNKLEEGKTLENLISWFFHATSIHICFVSYSFHAISICIEHAHQPWKSKLCLHLVFYAPKTHISKIHQLTNPWWM